PARTVRWLDGALAAVATTEGSIALAAGDPAWLDLAADRARHAGVAVAGVPTELALDYLGWAQVVAAAARVLGTTVVLVDEASRPERAAEVGAIAEQIGTVQLTRVVAFASEGDAVRTTRLAGGLLQTVVVRGPAVIGVRIAGEPIDEFPTPVPAKSLRRLELAELGLDASVLAHRALPPRAAAPTRKTVERVGDYLAMHVAARRSA
ncbi:MAG TPA: hypothetical protein VGF94_08660, partial [Kofleriaceae bacterium]